VKDKAPSERTILAWCDGKTPVEPIWADGDRGLLGNDQKGRTQRQTMALKGVRYRLYAHLRFRRELGEATTYDAQFRRRASQGKCFYQPYLGCREFPAYFELLDAGVQHSSPYAFDLDIGWGEDETGTAYGLAILPIVAPARNGGRGLKPELRVRRGVQLGVAPARNGGRGLKHHVERVGLSREQVAPARNGGRVKSEGLLSKQVFELLCRNVRRFQNLLQGSRLDGVVAGNNHEMFIVGHGDMFAFAQYIEADAGEGSHDAFMRDLWQLRHTLTSTVLNFFRRFRSSMLWR
jgi:hypothetical protein